MANRDRQITQIEDSVNAIAPDADWEAYCAKLREDGPVLWAESPEGWLLPTGEVVALTNWQKAVLLTWRERKNEISTLAISNIKKTGKTFVNAVLTAWRWLALPGLHFCVGNDLDQSAGRQFQEISDLCERNPLLKQHTTINKKQLTFNPTGSTLTALAVDAAGNAGANFLTSSHTEAWGIQHENSIRAFEELTPPPGTNYGFQALRVIDSYAGFENESELWHGIVDRGLNGQMVNDAWDIYQDGGLLLFHMEGNEAQKRCFRGNDLERQRYYTEQEKTLRHNTFLRLHENKRSQSTSLFVDVTLWENCLDHAIIPFDRKRQKMVLGADASTSRDCTALVGCVWNWQKKRVDVVFVKVWTPRVTQWRNGKPTIDLEETLGSEVERLRKLNAIDAIYFDPYQLHTLGLTWEKLGLEVFEFPQTSQRTKADTGLYDAIVSQSIAHHGDSDLTQHIVNAVAVETERGIRLDKAKAKKKIDAAVALSMSHFGVLERKPAQRQRAVRTYAKPQIIAGAKMKQSGQF